MHIGNFLNGYGRDAPPTQVPPGFDVWNGTVYPSTYSYYGFTVNENGALRTYPAQYSTDFFAARARGLIALAAPSRRPFFMSVAFLAPHSGAPREADDPGLATPAVAPRHANAFASIVPARSRPRSTRWTCPTSRPRCAPPADRGGSRRGDQ